MYMMRNALLGVGAALFGCGCGPSQHGGPSDTTWLIGRYLGGGSCGDELLTCGGQTLYEVEFFDDGTALSVNVECGIPRAPDNENNALWVVGEEDGVVELKPIDGEPLFRIAGANGVTGTVRRRDDDCLKLVLEARTEAPNGEPRIDTEVLHRGTFVYENTMVCTSTTVRYANENSEPPECPDPML